MSNRADIRIGVSGWTYTPWRGNFYPPGSTKEAIEQWVKTLPEPQQREATGFYTTELPITEHLTGRTDERTT